MKTSGYVVATNFDQSYRVERYMLGVGFADTGCGGFEAKKSFMHIKNGKSSLRKQRT